MPITSRTPNEIKYDLSQDPVFIITHTNMKPASLLLNC